MASAPAPVIERHIEVKLACPAEMDAPIAPRPVVPDGAELRGNAAGMSWLGEFTAWANGLFGTLLDAQKVCAHG
ncbi:hypothetical protein [Novosphingobium naphthalenivorans]|uniref:hypothetical protein n=1 Tax=Novosphingobium naphthalenivorans TaxID=273168 RepID=UPI00083543FC|nr:hypothetical protein [Novosphingobium naphthalenivorans]